MLDAGRRVHEIDVRARPDYGTHVRHRRGADGLHYRPQRIRAADRRSPEQDAARTQGEHRPMTIGEPPRFRAVGIEEARQLRDAGYRVLDVREPVE